MFGLYFLLVLFLQSTFIEDSIVGKYQVCSVACETIEVFSDSTFNYRFTGDLYQDQGCLGKITSLGNNRFLANSFEQPFPMIERTEPSLNKINTTVLDEENNPIISVAVYIVTGIDTLIGATDKNGFVEFPKVQVKSIFIQYITSPTLNYYPINLSSNVFNIKCKSDPNYIYITNEIWQIGKDNLCFIGRKEPYTLLKVL